MTDFKLELHLRWGIQEGQGEDFCFYLIRFMIELFKLNGYQCGLEQNSMESNEESIRR